MGLAGITNATVYKTELIFTGLWPGELSLFLILHMMTSSNGKYFRVTIPLCEEFIGHWWIPSQSPVTQNCDVFTQQPLRAPGYCRSPSGWAGGRAAGQTSPVNTLMSIIFHWSFSNLIGKDIYCPKISDEFDHGGSASLNMRIMDHLMSWTLLTFLNSFFKLKLPNFAYR